jgi:hypothetical protein
MAADDYAIVVGITAYPFHGNLNGPENDATAFYEWLIDPEWGDVPKDNIDLILTSESPPPYPSLDDAKPTAERIHKAIRKLHRLGQANIEAGNKRRVGRRLYIYLAGHGCTPRDDQTALLTANSDNVWTGSGFHILGQYNADWFYKSATFDEVLLFMDCCRNLIKVPALDQPYADVIDRQAVNNGRPFRALGAKWSQKTWERPMGDGAVHGVFTTALLDGLKGKAAENGQVTSGSLRRWLLREMQEYLTEEDKQNPEISKEPDVNDFGVDFPIVDAEDQSFPVRIHIPESGIGKKLQILTSTPTGDLVTVAEADASSGVVEVSLKRAIYIVQIIAAGLQKGVSVGGVGAVDVQL